MVTGSAVRRRRSTSTVARYATATITTTAFGMTIAGFPSAHAYKNQTCHKVD